MQPMLRGRRCRTASWPLGQEGAAPFALSHSLHHLRAAVAGALATAFLGGCLLAEPFSPFADDAGGCGGRCATGSSTGLGPSSSTGLVSSSGHGGLGGLGGATTGSTSAAGGTGPSTGTAEGGGSSESATTSGAEGASSAASG